MAWRLVFGKKKKNGEEGAPRKVLYNPRTGSWAKVPTDPRTYGTRENAEARAGSLAAEFLRECKRRKITINSTKGSGFGIVLGELSDGRFLVGIDLNSCRDPKSGVIANWAKRVIARFASYAEVSPSETGVKLFCLRPQANDELRELLGRENGEQLTRRAFTAGEHHEMAIDTARFYAITTAI